MAPQLDRLRERVDVLAFEVSRTLTLSSANAVSALVLLVVMLLCCVVGLRLSMARAWLGAWEQPPQGGAMLTSSYLPACRRHRGRLDA
jgi:hypothetical protein